MIRALFKFAKLPSGVVVIDTTSSSGEFRDLSPFVLTIPCSLSDIYDKLFGSIIFENLWQFSKVYKTHVGLDGEPTPEWFDWRIKGFADKKPHRYPMGKGAIPEYSLWNDEKLGYIDARKQIYAPEYAKNVVNTGSYKRLSEAYQSGANLILLDYDAYDHQVLGMSLKDVINNPNKKMGHAFVLIMMLTGMLEECLGQ